MPAIATALIASDDDYNRADPVDDIDSANPFVAEILGSLTALHEALDDQLMGLGLTPCTVVGDGTGTCATTAVPLIIPDTLTLDTSAAAGFPNGRLLTDPVIAVTLAVALLLNFRFLQHLISSSIYNRIRQRAGIKAQES